jgi:NADH dehydrogenase FAD-containing subunit
MAASTKPHVIIIGSGCSGLLVAQGLKKVSHLFTLLILLSAVLYLHMLIEKLTEGNIVQRS